MPHGNLQNPQDMEYHSVVSLDCIYPLLTSPIRLVACSPPWFHDRGQIEYPVTPECYESSYYSGARYSTQVEHLYTQKNPNFGRWEPTAPILCLLVYVPDIPLL